MRPWAATAALAVLVVLSLLLPGPVVASAEIDRSDSPTLVRPEEGEVWRLYLAVLGRRPDQGGFDYWVTRRVEGLPLAALAENFLASREFSIRFGATSDAEFLDLVYRNVLGRPGDDVGVAYWRGVLADGYARPDLVILFAESDEHRALTGTTLPELPPYDPVVRTVDDGDIGSSWRPGCPVDPVDLRAVELDHVDPGGVHRRGTLIVNEDAVDDVISVFGELYAARFPLASMVPVARFDGDDDASMAAGNTSGFNCRAVTGGSGWSRHAYGRAIDINPIENPYVNGDLVLPPAGVDYVDRSRFDPAMVRSGDVVTRAFGEAGWRWGGRFTSLADYQHFER